MFARWVDCWVPFVEETRGNGEVRADLDIR